MALEYDPDWPGLTDKNDASGAGSRELNRTEIKRIAGDLRTALDALITETQAPARYELRAPGDNSPMQGPPAGAGSLQDLRRECGLAADRYGSWRAAQSFYTAVNVAYVQLVGEGTVKRDGDSRSGGERLQAGTGAYADLVTQADAAAQTLLAMVDSYDRAEQANGADAPREA
ncbi:hypothetical protein [Microtetraspora fusca]|uniref:Uncharacterized protein n=1 Tax=Microtetraspora fusca TaxID=1997 RepID=A0ABW6V1C7_MICFU|nr:hypothetical protein [Microtetraspora fusca]